MPNYKKDEVMAAMRGKWEIALSELCGWDSACFDRRKHGPCPICGGKDRFRWGHKNPAKRDEGLGWCNVCGANDGMQWFCRSRKCRFGEAINDLGAWIGGLDVEVMETKAKNIRAAASAKGGPRVVVDSAICQTVLARDPVDNLHYAAVIDPVSGELVNVARVSYPDGSVSFAAAKVYPECANPRTLGGVSVIKTGRRAILLTSDYLIAEELDRVMDASVWCAFDSMNCREVAATYSGDVPLILVWADDDEWFLFRPANTGRPSISACCLLYGGSDALGDFLEVENNACK